MRFVSRKNVGAVPSVDYEQSRSQIKNGDVLMYRGRSLESKIIRWITGSAYSHAGLVARWNDRLMVMEAVGKGVVVTPISQNVRGYHGRVEWFTSTEEIPDDQRLQMVEFAQRELGKEYNLWSAVFLGIRVIFQKNVETKDKLRREKRLFCSHYVAQTYNAIGRDLKMGVGDRFMSPGDIAVSSRLKRIGILRKTKKPRTKSSRDAIFPNGTPASKPPGDESTPASF